MGEKKIKSVETAALNQVDKENLASIIAELKKIEITLESARIAFTFMGQRASATASDLFFRAHAAMVSVGALRRNAEKTLAKATGNASEEKGNKPKGNINEPKGDGLKP